MDHSTYSISFVGDRIITRLIGLRFSVIRHLLAAALATVKLLANMAWAFNFVQYALSALQMAAPDHNCRILLSQQTVYHRMQGIPGTKIPLESSAFLMSDGSSFATCAIVKPRNAVKVDPDADLALLGPLGCGIQTGAGTILNRLKAEFGSSAVVYGAGAGGLSAVMAARTVGCQQISAVDVHDSRPALAKKLGVSQVVKQSLNTLRPLGTVSIVGITPEVNLDIHNDLIAEGKSMVGVIERDSIRRVFIPQLIAYCKAGQFPFDKLIEFDEFDQINQAFEDSANGVTIKPVLKVS